MTFSFLPMMQAAEGGKFNIGEMIKHHLADSREWEFFGHTYHFPHWELFGYDVSLTKHIFFMLIAAFLVAVLLISAGRSAARYHAKGAAEGPKGAANVVEAFILFLRDEVAIKNIGHDGAKYTPYIVTVFFFILFCNMLGLMPYGASPTGNVSVTAALAIVTFLIVEISGMRALGPAGYAKTIFYIPHGLPMVMKPIMLAIMTPVELLGKLAKPFALTIRLYANMAAGHAVVLALTGLCMLAAGAGVIWIGAAPLIMAVAIMCLEIFVALLQAYIFAMLSAVFIGLIVHEH